MRCIKQILSLLLLLLLIIIIIKLIIIIIITIISGEGLREAEQGVTGGEEAGDRDPAGALHT